MAAELGQYFDLKRAQAIGLVPLVWQAVDPQATLAAYASLYLQEEVAGRGAGRSPGGATSAGFLPVLAHSIRIGG